MEINLKWRSMIMKAVGMLRRETLRASRVVSMNWEDGYDPEKDGGAQTVSPAPSTPTHCKSFETGNNNNKGSSGRHP